MPAARFRSLNISTSLYLLFGAVCLMLSGVLGASLIDGFRQQRAAGHVENVARAGRDVFAALQNVRLERGATRLALEGKEPADASQLGYLQEVRGRSEPAIDAVLAACARIDCAEGDETAQLAAARDKVAAMRKEADQAARAPLNARPNGLAKQANADLTRLVDLLEQISKALTLQSRMVDSFTAEQAQIKEAAYLARDAAGLEKYSVAAMIGKKEISPELRSKMAVLRGKTEAGWRLVRDLAGRPGAPEAVTAAVKAAEESYFGQLVMQRNAIEQAIEAGHDSPVTAVEFARTLDAATTRLVAVSEAALDAIVGHAERRAAQAQRTLVLQALLLLGALAIGGIGFFVVRRRVAGPIAGISAAMLRVAGGDLSGAIPYRERGDEIGRLAGALGIFKENAEAKQRMEAERERERLEKEERARRVHGITQTFDASVSQMLQGLSAAATELDATAGGMSSTAEETSRQSTAVAAASEQTSANVQTVAAAIEELSASVGEIGRQVAQSSSIAGRATAEAHHTEQTVKGLSAAAQRIGEVVTLISDIASQTNLLALNATIEAARAGEAGKGFAVVASEVKSLASQTAKATEEISSQIGAVQEETERAVHAIADIAGVIGEINEIAAAIASAVEEQSAATQDIARNVRQAAVGTGEVTANIADLRKAATHTGAASAQVLQAAQELSQHSETLKGLVGSFLAEVRAA